MDKSAELLCEQTFSSQKEAQLAICQMIRSFVPKMFAIRTRRTQTGTTTTFVPLSNNNKKLTSVEEVICVSGQNVGGTKRHKQLLFLLEIRSVHRRYHH